MEKRWYDKYDQAIETFEMLKRLNGITKRRLSKDIIEVANQIKALHREEEEPELSIGLERVLGLYQSQNKRRWYDKNKELSAAIKTISTLPEEDFVNIMEGLSVSMRG